MQDLRACRVESTKLQATLFEKDLLLQRKEVEVRLPQNSLTIFLLSEWHAMLQRNSYVVCRSKPCLETSGI